MKHAQPCMRRSCTCQVPVPLKGLPGTLNGGPQRFFTQLCMVSAAGSCIEHANCLQDSYKVLCNRWKTKAHTSRNHLSCHQLLDKASAAGHLYGEVDANVSS